MKTFYFHKNKYGYELLMDLGRFEKNPNFFFESEIHTADFYEIIFFEFGNGHLRLDQQTIPLSDKTVVFLSPWQKRSWWVDKNKLKGYYLSFQEDFLANFFSDKLFVYRLQYFYNPNNPLYIRTDEEKFRKTERIFLDILAEIENHKSDSDHLIRSLLYFMLIKLNRTFAEIYQLSPETFLNNYAYIFKQQLELHITQKQRVQEYANLLGISRISLNKAIKKQFGQTASEMIKSRLLHEIKTELLFSSKTISEIAHDLSFSEHNNLIRFFKASTGVTPFYFRNSYQIDTSVS